MKKILISLNGFLPQSAYSHQAVFCKVVGLPGFCNHVRSVQLSALLQPKRSDGGHEVDAKG